MPILSPSRRAFPTHAITREVCEAILAMPKDHAEVIPETGDGVFNTLDLQELARVYLAWLDAPIGDTEAVGESLLYVSVNNVDVVPKRYVRLVPEKD